MRHKLSFSMIVFTALAVGCGGSSGSQMGCSQKKNPPPAIDLKLGAPGETNVENNLPASDNLHILEGDETIQFETDDGVATIEHHSDRQLEEGQIIIANPDQQYLVRIHKILEAKDGQSRVELRQSRISEIVGDNDGSLSIETTPIYAVGDIENLNKIAQKSAKDSKESVYQVDDNGRVVMRNLELFSVEINNQGRLTKGLNTIMGVPALNPYEKISVSGAAGGKYRAVINEAVIEIVPTVRSKSQWSGGRLTDLTTRLDTRVRYRVDMTYEVAGQIQIEALLDAFMPKKVIPIRVPGAIPVYLDIELGIPGGISIQAKGEGKTRIIYESEYEFLSTMKYDKENGLTTDKDQRTVVNDKKIETNGKATQIQGELFLQPQVTTRLYRVVGPYAYFKPYVRSEVDWPSTYKKDDLFVGVTGGVGIELSEPIFLKKIVSFDSGKIFDFYKSFDLDSAGEAPLAPLGVGSQLQNSVTIDSIGPEGFVVLSLKEITDNGFLRYELVRSTSKGLMVPSETFYMDGKLFYYPLDGANTDSFAVDIISGDGQRETREIQVQSTDSVLAAVKSDRFGLTNNSYRVATGEPQNFSREVPQKELGNWGGVAIAEPEEEEFDEVSVAIVSQCFAKRVQNVEAFDIPSLVPYFKNCDSFISLYDRFLQENPSGESFGGRANIFVPNSVKIENVQLDSAGQKVTFRKYDTWSFVGYLAKTTEGKKPCSNELSLEAITEEKEFGIRVVHDKCLSGAVAQNALKDLGSEAFGLEGLSWTESPYANEKKAGTELRVAKDDLLKVLTDRETYDRDWTLFLSSGGELSEGREAKPVTRLSQSPIPGFTNLKVDFKILRDERQFLELKIQDTEIIGNQPSVKYQPDEA